MKTYKFLLASTVLIVSLLSCARNVYVYKKVPPGQAKKVSGHKSAKLMHPDR
jgi:hypothetical protein